MIGLWRTLAIAVALSISGALSPLSAEEYPSKPIHLMTSGAPGGLADLLTRTIADGLSGAVGQPVVVENRPGAMTMVANRAAAEARPDGYTLYLAAVEATIVPHLNKDAASFDATRDFTAIARVINVWSTFVASPKFSAKSLQELISHAKANPGQVRYGTNGVGGTLHLSVELLQTEAGIKLTHIPYQGTARVTNDVISGEVEMAAMSVTSAARNRDRIRILAQTGPTRASSLPDVPTTAELGLPDVRVEIWFGLVAPPKTPQPIVARIARAMDQLLKQKDFQQKLTKMGLDPAYLGPSEFAEQIATEKKKWSRLIPQWNISVN